MRIHFFYKISTVLVSSVENSRVKSLSERIDDVQENMSSIIRGLEPVRNFGEAYMRRLSQGPVGVLFRAGSSVAGLMRRWDFSPRFDRHREWPQSNYEYEDYY